MKRFTEIILAGLAALFLYAGTSAGQVGNDGNLAYTVSNFQAAAPAANGPTDFVVRNRLDSGCPWTASAEAMLMSRSGGKSSDILVDPVSGAEPLNSNGFNFPWAAGERVGIVAEDLICCCDVEVAYFGMDEWSAAKAITASDDGAELRFFNSPARSTYVLPGETVNFNYVSRLHSTEINLRHPLWERLSVLMGFRYLELHEELNGNIDGDPTFDVNVNNHLYGGQIGLNVAFVNCCNYSIEGAIKAGVYGNASNLGMTTPTFVGGLPTKHTAATGEIGLTAIFQVTCNLSARLGYQAMWIDGVAIASDQVEFVNTANAKPYMGGTLFYHGATAGLEYAF